MTDIHASSEEKWLSSEKLQLLHYLLEEEDIQGTSQSKITPVADHQDAPLAFAQERLWFLEQLKPDTALYNQFFGIRLSGHLHIAALEQSINEIIHRHEILRTAITLVDGQPRQHIFPEQLLTLIVEDLQIHQESQRDQEIEQKAAQEARQPFHLSQGPLLRVRLLRITVTEHILLATIHHIAFDGWSRGIFVRELIELYKAYDREEKPSLPRLPIQYADFALWQRQWLQGEVLDSQMSYWKQKLGDNPPVLAIPTDHPRLAAQTFQGATQSIVFDRSLTESLKALSLREGLTLFMTLLAVFQTLLALTAEQDDIVIGTRIAGRDRVETEGLIGCFINAVVLRTDLSGDPTFREICQRVKETALGAFSHQDLPFEKVVESLRLKRDTNRQPLFQVMFVLQTASTTMLELPGLVISPLGTGREMARYDLDCSMKEGDDGRLWCGLTYNTHLFQQETIQRMLERFQLLLETVCVDPDLPFQALPRLSMQDRQQIEAWNDAARSPVEEVCLQRLFEDKVAEMPAALAVVCADQNLTYQTLNRYANQLAHRLRKLGVGPEKTVGVCLPRSQNILISLLAILKAGGVYVPLDPAHPPEHLSGILADCSMTAIITDAASLSRISAYTGSIICLDADEKALAEESDKNLPNNTVLDHAMYVMFTSGSTGRPKGVVVPQRQVLNRFNWMWRTYPLQAHERACQRTTASFTPSIWEMLGPLLQGVPVVIIPDTHVKDPHLLIQTLAAEGVTRIVIVPSLLEAILNTNHNLQQLLAPLKLWSIGGELLSTKLAQRFQERLPIALLINQYGATEMSDIAYCDACSQYQHSAHVPAGHPITNTRVYILDGSWQMRPIGLPGELHVGGPGVPRGYLNRPDLTAERFIPDPFSSEPGARLYNVGDMARYLPDGVIDLLGRRDHQVKLRGFRVEMAGIESVLREHPLVQRAAVVMREDERGDKVLTAYVVPGPGEAPSSSLLRDFLKDRLPEYMVPATVVVLDTLPQTPNGKIDRMALLTMHTPVPASGVTLAQPQTELEHVIAKIWQEVLQLPEVGVHSNFFDLGGHSLLSIEVRDKLQGVLQREITLIELFEHPTISSLAQHLAPQQEEQHVLEQVQEKTDAQRAARKRRKQFRQTAEKHGQSQEEEAS